MSFTYLDEYSYFTNVCLNVTDDCNLACVYCFVQQKPHFMTLETAFKAIDFIVNNLKQRQILEIGFDKTKTANVSFFGGEPTLMWDKIIKPTVAYAEANYPGLVHFNITTNGTLLDDERIHYLGEHDIPILLSMDGGEKVQNLNRPCKNGGNSFPLVEKNIPSILKEFPNTTFRSTINQDTCDTLFDTFLFAASKGFTNIFMCPNCREEWSETNIDILRKEVNKIFTYFVFSFLNGEMPIYCTPIASAFIHILNHDVQVVNQDFANLEIQRQVSRCGLGSGSASISYDGKIFGCQEQDSRDTNGYFYIGNIFDGIDKEKHSQILSDYHKLAKVVSEDKTLCDTCPIRTACSEDICPSVTHDMFGDFFTRPKIDCYWNMFLVNGAIASMKILVDGDNNQLFKQYLDEICLMEEDICDGDVVCL